MNLQDYEWSQNPRGLQNKGPFQSVDPRRYTRPQAGWAALVAGGDEYVDEAAELVERGVTPIVRIHRSNPGAMAVPDDWYDTFRQYADVGVRWFELYSEPNTEDFWPQGSVEVTWENEDVIGPLMDNWLDWAERIVAMGGYPAFPALGASADRATSTVYWLDAMLRYLKEVHADRFLRIVGRGLWAATHPRIGNHFYQEPPGGPPNVARPYYQQSADEGGWHFEYPYDPIMQHQDPGRTVFRGSGSSARFGDVSGLVAAGEAFNQLLKHHLDAGPVPVVGTAGGILPMPEKDADPLQPDTAYPPYDFESHAEAVAAMWKWTVRQGPPWFFGLCLSDESLYYEAQGIVPAVERMADDPPLRKQVPDLDTGGTATPVEPEPEEELVVEGEATPVEEDEELPAWLAEAQRRADYEEEATGYRREGGEPGGARMGRERIDDDIPLPPELGGEGETPPEPERLQTRGLDHDAEEMLVDEAEGVEHAPDAYEEGEIPDWLAEELPPEELQELMGDTPSDRPQDESLEELIAIDSPEEPVEYDSADVAATAAEAGRPVSEVDPDYEDLTGQVVDAWQDPETAGNVPNIRLDDLPQDMQEELAARTGAQHPEDLAEMTEEDDWEEDFGGDQPEPLPPDLEETEDLLLGQLGGEAIPPEMEQAGDSGPGDRATQLTEAAFAAGEIEDDEPDQPTGEGRPFQDINEADMPAWLAMADREPPGGELQGTTMPWEEETEPGEALEDHEREKPPGGAPAARPVPHPHEGPPGDDIRNELLDMTGEWSEDDPRDHVPTGDLPSAQEVEQSVPNKAPLDGEWAAERARSGEASVEVTHHWLVFGPGVDPGWFFDAGWRYWQQFRPTIAADWQQMALIPAGRSVTLTILAPSEDIDEMTARIHAFRPDVLVDAVECDSREDLRRELEWRAAQGRRLG